MLSLPSNLLNPTQVNMLQGGDQKTIDSGSYIESLSRKYLVAFILLIPK
ncbi:MAG: hypothetical protein ABTQ25_04180 [Nitrosomonas ureae]